MSLKKKSHIKKSYLALGLMSGTSGDGIDVSLVRTDGDSQIEAISFETFPYKDGFKSLLKECTIPSRRKDPNFLNYCERRLTLLHVEAVKNFLESKKIKADKIDVIGFHGHTVSHNSRGKGSSHQIGDGALLAYESGIDVIDDFRSNDIAKGGQGAPLVPIFHLAIAKKVPYPIAFVNIGGVSNITWIDCDGRNFLGFDVGPGNTLIDRWMQKFTGKSFDPYGRYAARGNVEMNLLETFLADRHFRRKPPKSFDILDFNFNKFLKLSIEDGVATLTAITAHAIFMAQNYFPQKAHCWFICGGGRKNKFLFSMLKDLIEKDPKVNMTVSAIEEMGWNGDAIESQAFAYLAIRSIKGLPLTFPSTTGVSVPTKGGVFHSKDLSYSSMDPT